MRTSPASDKMFALLREQVRVGVMSSRAEVESLRPIDVARDAGSRRRH
jgi:hypothetical protein